MGAFRGSITYRRYHVRGSLPADFRERFVAAIELRRFRELDPNEEAELRAGWCSIEDPFDLELAPEKLFFNAYLNLGFRVDTWKIPRALFRRSFREAERQYLATHGGEKLNRAQKKNLEAVVVSTLRRKLVPAMKVVDLSWAIDEGVVRFFAHGAKLGDLMTDLFEKTFELELVPEGAYVSAEHQGLPEGVLDVLPTLEPELFHGADRAEVA